MVGVTGAKSEGVDTVLVRYWAAARAAAGVNEERFDAPTTLAALLSEVVSRHSDRPRLRDVVPVCSVLVGDRPAGTSDPRSVVLHGGETVELLPPFAGG